MASDSAATFSTGVLSTIGQQEVTKVRVIGDGLLLSSTGAVGISQIVESEIKQMWEAKDFSGSRPSGKTPAAAMQHIASRISSCLKGIHESAARIAPLVGNQAASLTAISKTMVALPIAGKPCLLQFDLSGAPEQATKQLPFVALGLGQPIADPFLAFLKRILWNDSEPTVREGRFVAAWTVRHVSQTIPGGVGGKLQMASLTLNAGKGEVDRSDPAEHEEWVTEAEKALRVAVNQFHETGKAKDLPTVSTKKD